MLPRNNHGAAIGMVVAFVVVAMLSEFNRALGAGEVPLPGELRWLVPILGAGLAALVSGITPYLRVSVPKDEDRDL